MNDAQLLSPSRNISLGQSDLDSMVSESLYSSSRKQLLSLLNEFSSMFNFDGGPLGIARRVHHSIGTGDARPLRLRQYEVSPCETAKDRSGC